MKAQCKQCGHPRKRPGTCDPCHERAYRAARIAAGDCPRRLPAALQMAAVVSAGTERSFHRYADRLDIPEVEKPSPTILLGDNMSPVDLEILARALTSHGIRYGRHGR